MLDVLTVNVAGIILEGTHIRGYRRDGRFVGQVVVVTARGHRCKSRFVQNLGYTAGGVPVGIHLSSGNGRFVLDVRCRGSVQFVPVGLHLSGSFRQILSDVLSGDVAGIVLESAHIGGYSRDGRFVLDVGLGGGVCLIPIGLYLLSRNRGLVAQVIVTAAGGNRGQVRLVHDILRAGGIGLRPVGGQLGGATATARCRDGVVVRACDIRHVQDDTGSASGHRYGGRNTILSIGAVRHGERGSGVVGVVDGIGVHIAAGYGPCDVGNAVAGRTRRAGWAGLTSGANRSGRTCRACFAVGAVTQDVLLCSASRRGHGEYIARVGLGDVEGGNGGIGDVAGIVLEGAYIRGYGGNGRRVDQVIVVARESHGG